VVMGVHYSPKIVTDGLVLCYDAANTRSYPGTGTTWTDISAGFSDSMVSRSTADNGTLTNGPTFDTTNKGSIVFDGANDRVAISLGSLPTPQSSSNFTYEAVVKFDSLGWRTVFSQDAGSGTGRIFLGVHGSNSKLVTFITGGVKQPSFSALSTGTIYHVALGISGTNIYMGLNGVWDSVNTASFSYSGTGGINIGTEPGAAGTFLDGNVYSVRMYNRFLEDSELYENYKAIKGRYS